MSAQTDAFRKPVFVTVPAHTLISTPDPSVHVTTVQVEKPIGVPLEPLYPLYQVSIKNSIEYKIEDIEGQKSRGSL